jgi:hypothetical protein
MPTDANDFTLSLFDDHRFVRLDPSRPADWRGFVQGQ